MEKVVAKRKVCHQAWRKSKSDEDKHTLDVAKKEVYALCWRPKLQEFTANLLSESGRKNCFRISRQMAREGGGVISVCCMKNDVVSDGMKNIWRCSKILRMTRMVMGPCCLISEEEDHAAAARIRDGWSSESFAISYIKSPRWR